MNNPKQIKPPSGEKLQKVLARSGLGSRREIERWIEAGLVKVNNRTAKIGDRVSAKDKIFVEDKPINTEVTQATKTRVLLYHKPVGEICTRNDPEGRPTVFQKLPPIREGRWILVGRLDLNSAGLLIFTTSGDLANALMHPSNQIEREYAVRVYGQVDAKILQNLKKGVMLEDGMARFDKISDEGGEGSNHWYHVVLHEGRNREVRRLWESQGVVVSRLIRIRFGDIKLDRSLRPSRALELSEAEIRKYFGELKRTVLKKG